MPSLSTGWHSTPDWSGKVEFPIGPLPHRSAKWVISGDAPFERRVLTVALASRLIRRTARQRWILLVSSHVERDKPVDHRVDLLRHFQRQEMSGADGLGRDQLRAQHRKAI